MAHADGVSADVAALQSLLDGYKRRDWFVVPEPDVDDDGVAYTDGYKDDGWLICAPTSDEERLLGADDEHEIGSLYPPAAARLAVAAVNALPGLLALAAGTLFGLRAAGVDPQLLRWCSWPGCLSSFDATTGPKDRGWIRLRTAGGLLCPTHSEAGHRVTFDFVVGGALAANCSCGESAEVAPTNQAAVMAWWETHVSTLPEPTP